VASQIALRARSRLLAAALIAAHALALGAALAIGASAGVRIALAAAALASAAWSFRRWRGGFPAAVSGLTCLHDGRLGVRLRDGRESIREVEPATLVLPALVVIAARESGGARVAPLVVLADSCLAAELRKLRVWLRWRTRASGAR
jgi:hypothetical protein